MLGLTGEGDISFVYQILQDSELLMVKCFLSKFNNNFHVIPRYSGDVKDSRVEIRKTKKSLVPYAAEE